MHQIDQYQRSRQLLLDVVKMPTATVRGRRDAAARFLGCHVRTRGHGLALTDEIITALCKALGLPKDASREQLYHKIRATVGPNTVSDRALSAMTGFTPPQPERLVTLISRPKRQENTHA